MTARKLVRTGAKVGFLQDDELEPVPVACLLCGCRDLSGDLVYGGKQVGVCAEAVAELGVAVDLLVGEIDGLGLYFTSHYLAVHPLPDPSDWMQIADPAMRLRVALTETYAYYQRTEGMQSRVLPDMPDMPVMQRIMEPYFAYWEQVRDGLAEEWGIQGRQNARLRAVLAHLLDFRTWYAFVRQQHLADDELVALAVQFVRCIASE